MGLLVPSCHSFSLHLEELPLLNTGQGDGDPLTLPPPSRDIQDRSIIKIYRKEPLYAAFPGSHLTNGDLRVRLGVPRDWGGWADKAREHSNLSAGTRPHFGEENLEAEAEGASINGGVTDFSNTPLDILDDSSRNHSFLLGFPTRRRRVVCGLPFRASLSAASTCILRALRGEGP